MLCHVLFVLAVTTVSAGDGVPPFKITTKRDEDRVEVGLVKGKVVFSVHCPRGISHVVIEQAGGMWPDTVVLWLQAGKLVNRLWKHGKEDTPLDVTSPYCMEVRIVDEAGKLAKEIPLKGGYFEMALLKALFDGNPKSINMNWIDFYRDLHSRHGFRRGGDFRCDPPVMLHRQATTTARARSPGRSRDLSSVSIAACVTSLQGLAGCEAAASDKAGFQPDLTAEFNAPLVPNRRGTLISRHTLRKSFLTTCKVSGHERLASVTIHHGRHTFISHALAGGRTLAEVRDAAGHANVSITSGHWHVVVDDTTIGTLFQFSLSDS